MPGLKCFSFRRMQSHKRKPSRPMDARNIYMDICHGNGFSIIFTEITGI